VYFSRLLLLLLLLLQQQLCWGACLMPSMWVSHAMPLHGYDGC
jgi:hypothetical protein